MSRRHPSKSTISLTNQLLLVSQFYKVSIADKDQQHGLKEHETKCAIVVLFVFLGRFVLEVCINYLLSNLGLSSPS